MHGRSKRTIRWQYQTVVFYSKTPLTQKHNNISIWPKLTTLLIENPIKYTTAMKTGLEDVAGDSEQQEAHALNEIASFMRQQAKGMEDVLCQRSWKLSSGQHNQEIPSFRVSKIRLESMLLQHRGTTWNKQQVRFRRRSRTTRWLLVTISSPPISGSVISSWYLGNWKLKRVVSSLIIQVQCWWWI